MDIKTLNMILVSAGVAMFIGGAIVMFVASFWMGVLLIIVGIAVALFGATVFKVG